jgi:hypothetical protein
MALATPASAWCRAPPPSRMLHAAKAVGFRPSLTAATQRQNEGHRERYRDRPARAKPH